MCYPKGHERLSILLCTLFSFCSTWRGAYKVTDWFSSFPDADFYFHLLFSFYTAFVIFFILYTTLTSNIKDGVDTHSANNIDNSKVSTPYVLSIIIVIGLSLSLSVIGLLEGYKDYEKNILSKIDDILDDDAQSKLKSLKDAEELYIYGPVKILTKEIGRQIDKYRNDSARCSYIDKTIEYLNEKERDDQDIFKRKLAIVEKYHKNKNSKHSNMPRLDMTQKDFSKRIMELHEERKGISVCGEKISEKINILNNYTEEISRFSLGCEHDTSSKFREIFYKAKNELNINSEEIQSLNLEIDQNKLKKLNEKECSLKKLNEQKSFLDIFKNPEKQSHLILTQVVTYNIAFSMP